MQSHKEKIILEGHPPFPLIIGAPTHKAPCHLYGDYSVSACITTCTQFISEPESQGFNI